MTAKPHSHLPYGETGSGHYGNFLAAQDMQHNELMMDHILKCIGKFSFDFFMLPFK